MSLKAFLLGLAGAAVLLILVLFWGRITGRIADIAEAAWCWNAASADSCEIRAGFSFLIWCVAGIASLLFLGFVFERVVGRK